MSFTLSTLPMLLLTAYLWHRAKGQLLPVAMFMSIFAAAAIVNFGIGGLQIGVQPAFAILFVILFKSVLGRRLPKFKLWNPRKTTLALIALFVLYAAVSAFVNPFLFQGVLVTNAKIGTNMPLRFEPAHLNQLVYLLISFAIFLIAAYRTSPAELTMSLDWYIGGMVLASLIALYQSIASKTGLPFPGEFFYTNNYVMYEAYDINGFTRVNSTFTEASSLAFAVTIALALVLWRLLSGSITQRNVLYALVMAAALVNTLSTTGYVCLAYIGAVAAGRYLLHWSGNQNARLARLLLSAPAFIAIIAMMALPAGRDSFMKLLHTVVLDKSETTSYQDRTRENDYALQTAADTYWLGAGWGVCRASSFIPTVLGNVGIPGLLLFFGFCFKLTKPGFGARKCSQLQGAAIFALGAVIVDLVVAAPELVSPIIWLLFAILAKLERARSFALPSAIPQFQLAVASSRISSL